MKSIIAITLLIVTSQAVADEYVNGYVRQDGTYVQPHVRSSPNNQQWDNYSTKGNTNPYTGQQGTQQNTDNGQYAPRPTPYHLRRSGY